MSKEYPCIYHKADGVCTSNEEPGFTDYCLYGPCPYETPSIADEIRQMSDEELAQKILATDVILNEHGSEVITLMYCDDKGACAGRDEEKEDLCDRESRLACVLRWIQSAAPKKTNWLGCKHPRYDSGGVPE